MEASQLPADPEHGHDPEHGKPRKPKRPKRPSRQKTGANSKPYLVNVVTGSGIHLGQVDSPPTLNKSFPRILVFDNETGSSSWLKKDDGSEIPNYESPNGDYSDLSASGVTWHQR